MVWSEYLLMFPIKGLHQKPFYQQNLTCLRHAAKRIVRQLNKKGNKDLQEYVDQINKAVEQGTLVRLSKWEVSHLHSRPHWFTHHGIVYKPCFLLQTVTNIIQHAIYYYLLLQILQNMLFTTNKVMPHSTVVVVSFCQRAKKIRSFFQIVETFKTASYFFAET